MRTITFNANPEYHAAAMAVAGEDELNRALGYAAAWGVTYTAVRIALYVDRDMPIITAVYRRDRAVVFYMEASYNKEAKRFEFRS